MKSSLHVLILAAGASTRMGVTIKQLLPWKNTTLLGHAIQQAKKVSPYVTMVLGANADSIQPSIANDIDVIINLDWKKGMGTSISEGIRHMNLKSKPKGVLIMLVDQPLLDFDYLNELKKEFETGKPKIVGTAYGKRVGVPAIFDASLFSVLADLHEDFGAKQIIEQQKEFTKILDPKGLELDIDTIDDYNQITDK